MSRRISNNNVNNVNNVDNDFSLRIDNNYVISNAIIQ